MDIMENKNPEIYASPQNLKWPHFPHTICFIPKNGANDGAKRNNKQVVTGKTMN
jgi:hypothetical protein